MDASSRPRVIITSDLEVDDMNSFVHLALYLNLLDVEAFVTTSSQYHFLGDGEHTLAEVTPHWRTKGRAAYEQAVVPHHPDPAAGELTSYRPFPATWISDLWTHEYAEAWPTLCANAQAAGEPAFPAPDELVARTYVGNVAFEGDVRADTPGSDVIKRAILDNDPRTLWLLSWGGMNTIVRALMSIAEDYQGTAAWDDVRQRVYDKVRVMGIANGVGQDNSWLDHGCDLFPELVFWRVPFTYGGYVDAKSAQEDSLELFQAPWPKEHLIDGNGPLMGRYLLYGDGTRYADEPDRFQFGLHATLDWGWESMEPLVFNPGDFMAEGDSMTYIPLLPFGLRGAGDPTFDTVLGPMFRDGEPNPEATGFDLSSFGKPQVGSPNPFLRAYQEDFAARAAWCAHEPAACNHAPVISSVTPDATVAAGARVALSAEVVDPDDDAVHARWWVDTRVSTYEGASDLAAWEACIDLPASTSAHAAAASFTMPADARPGDRFVITLSARDEADRPMTRYAEVALTVR